MFAARCKKADAIERMGDLRPGVAEKHYGKWRCLDLGSGTRRLGVDIIQ